MTRLALAEFETSTKVTPTAAASAALSVELLPLARALPVMQALAASGISSPASDPFWVRLWAEHVNPEIFVVVAHRSGVPVLALPLEMRLQSGLRVARFVGGSHANANFPIMGAALNANEAKQLFSRLRALCASAPCNADLLELDRQLAMLNGLANPLLVEGSTVSPNVALSLRLDGTFDSLLERRSGKRKRKRFRSSQRKFEAAGGFKVHQQVEHDQTSDVLDAYFALKSAQFARKGLTDVFGNPNEKAFFKALFQQSGRDTENGSQRHHFGLSALEVAGSPRAIMGWSRHGATQSIHFMTFAHDELAQASPGDYLNHSLIEHGCHSGVETYDLGVGDEGYKRAWCDIETWHRDVVCGLSVRGRLLALQITGVQAAKRRIKNSSMLWPMVKRMRQALGGKPDETPAAPNETNED
jgi:CelD/BcsL family acetyltransferase involved in cellulose biosynthesis